ncbi:MAG: hypothetical protein JWO12_3598 [Frankiales bacterium]|nr:hypothetical protein [Frankiales bacterium]
MVVLGLLLLLAAAGVTVAVVLDNTDPVSVSAFGSSLSNLSLGELFLGGVAVGGIAVLALALLVMSARRRRSRRLETKQQVRHVRTEKQQLQEENEALRAQLADPPYPATSSSGTEAVERRS